MRYQFLGYIIAKCSTGWEVIDWDYETETPIGPIHKSKAAAEKWVCDML